MFTHEVDAQPAPIYLVNQSILNKLEERFADILDKKFKAHLSSVSLPEQAKKKNYLNRKATAEKLNISLPTLNDWTKKGLLIGYRIGHRILYLEHEIDEALTKIRTG